jgi:acetyltransferase-like isoleucine patch superfamily enzyme
VRTENRPYFIRQIKSKFSEFYTRHFLIPQFDKVGDGLNVTGPWEVEVWGAGVELGKKVHLRASKGAMIRFATWQNGDRQGRITLGDYVLISPGNHIIASEHIEIGNNTMIASNCYISDSDWHDTYDRTAELDKHAPIKIGENAWLGARVMVSKGVSIGNNSIIAAGSVVVSDIPDNVIAGGNPAKVIKQLDPNGPFRKREALLEDPGLDQEMENLARYILRNNTVWSWLRVKVWPTKAD